VQKAESPRLVAQGTPRLALAFNLEKASFWLMGLVKIFLNTSCLAQRTLGIQSPFTKKFPNTLDTIEKFMTKLALKDL